MEKIKVLFYNSTLLKGGTEAYIKELIKCLDKSKFQIDIVIKDGDVVDEFIYDELKNCGCNVFLAKGSFVKRILFLRKFFKQTKNTYDIAHINATSQGAGLISYMAKKYGKIKKVIFHSHMGGNDNNPSVIDKIGAKMMFNNTDYFVSCSSDASVFMFGKEFCDKHKVQVLNNSVDTQKFDLNLEKRKQIRKELNLSDKDFAIIHVGRFAPQKNHKKVISAFESYLNINPNAKLFLIGNGDLLDETKKQVKSLNIENNVTFLGLQNNVQDFLQAADLFLFPSVHEGLGIVLIEAQCSGLPAVVSSTVPKLACLCDDIFKFVDLDADDAVWADAIKSFEKTKRVSRKETLKNLGFDKETAAKIVEEIYLK